MVTVINNEYFVLQREQLGPYGTNTYILTCRHTKESLVIDAPGEADKVIEMLEGTVPKYLVLTHNHPDHTDALAELLLRLNIPLVMHKSDSHGLPVRPGILVNDGEKLELGKLPIEVIHTPGHTPGSICCYTPDVLLAGDTLFPGGPGKTWSPSDFRQLLDSITGKIFTLPDSTMIWPGHGDGTTIAQSKEEYLEFAMREYPDDLYGDVLWASA